MGKHPVCDRKGCCSCCCSCIDTCHKDENWGRLSSHDKRPLFEKIRTEKDPVRRYELSKLLRREP